MNILIIIISLFLGFFARPTFAAEINIEDLEIDGITVGNTFPVTFQVAEAIPESAYYFKIYGGPSGDNFSIQTYNKNNNQFLSYDATWIDLPIFYTDSFGNATVNGIAKIPEGKSYCPDNFYYCYSLFVDIADLVNQIGISDAPLDIMVFPSPLTPTPISPTVTSIPTTIPTSPLTPTPTPTISSTPHNQVPTLSPTPTVNMKIFGVITESTPSATPTEDYSLIPTEASSSTFIETGSNPPEIKNTPSLKKTNLLPIILLGSGISFLSTSLIFLKINKK